MQIRNLNVLVGALAAGLAMTGGQAAASTLTRSFVQNATGFCQPALPAFEGQIRKRPLAIQNEGTAAAFVSCSFMGTDAAADGITEILLYADNRTAADIELTCTLVTGASGVSPTYYPKTITLPALSTANGFRWSEEDNGGNPFSHFSNNVSCNLPVGTGLSISFIYYEEEVGQL